MRESRAAADEDVKETQRVVVDQLKGNVFINQYLVIKDLGRGAHGTVKLVYNTQDDMLYAMKVIHKKKLRKQSYLMDRTSSGAPRFSPGGRMSCGAPRTSPSILSHNQAEFSAEIAVMKALDHPNVVHLYEVIVHTQRNRLLMVMEYVEGGCVLVGPSTLHKQPIAEQVAIKYFRDMLKGLEYLHYNRVVHGDLKPDNMLLTSAGRVKISDFGSARFCEENDTIFSTGGTPAFMAPEMCTGKPFSAFKGDIWALGVCLFMFVFGHPPFNGKTSYHVYEAVQHKPLVIPDTVTTSTQLRKLLHKLLEKDPAKRISISELLCHKWVTQDGQLPDIQTSADRYVEPVFETVHARNGPAGAGCSAELPIAVPATQLHTLIPDAEEHTFQDGEYIIREGEYAKGLFLITAGTCEIHRAQPKRKSADEDFADAFEDDDEDEEEEDEQSNGISSGSSGSSLLSGMLSSSQLHDVFIQHAGSRSGSLHPLSHMASGSLSSSATHSPKLHNKHSGTKRLPANALQQRMSMGEIIMEEIPELDVPEGCVAAAVDEDVVLSVGNEQSPLTPASFQRQLHDQSSAPGYTVKSSSSRAALTPRERLHSPPLQAGLGSSNANNSPIQASRFAIARSAANSPATVDTPGSHHGLPVYNSPVMSTNGSPPVTHHSCRRFSACGAPIMPPSSNIPLAGGAPVGRPHHRRFSVSGAPDAQQQGLLRQLYGANIPPLPTCHKAPSAHSDQALFRLQLGSKPDQLMRASTSVGAGNSQPLPTAKLKRAIERTDSMHRRMAAMVIKAKQHGARRRRTPEGGDKVLVSVRGPGGVLGDTSADGPPQPSMVSVAANGPVKVLLIPHDKLRRYMDMPLLRAALNKLSNTQLVQETMERFAQYESEVKQVELIRQSVVQEWAAEQWQADHEEATEPMHTLEA